MRLPSFKKPIVLTVALTGPTYPASRYRHIPLSVEDVVDDGRRCYVAGARVIHFHARNPESGLQFADLDHYQRVTTALELYLPGVPVGVPSSRKGESEIKIEKALANIDLSADPATVRRKIVEAEMIRACGIEVRPARVTTFTPPELLIGGEEARAAYEHAMKGYSDITRKAWKHREVMCDYYRALTGRARELGVSEELEITTWKAFDVIERIAADPSLGLPKAPSFVVLLGYSESLPIAKQTYDNVMTRIAEISTRANVTPYVTIGAAIHPASATTLPERRGHEGLQPGKHDLREVIEWVAGDARVASFRVGLEDTPELFGGMPTNAELVMHARRVFESLGVAIELDVDRAREQVGLPAVTPLCAA